MPTIEEGLLKGEKIIYKTGVHWIVFTLPASIFILGIIFYELQFYLRNIAVLLFVIALVLGWMSFSIYFFSEFAVTNQRVLVKRGMLTQTIMEITFNKIESIQVKQDITGRLFGYGDIDIVGVGSTDDHITQITMPYEFRKAVLEVMGSSLSRV